MNKINKFLIILLVICLFTLIHFYPIISYSPAPSIYAGGAQYYLDYALQNGQLINIEQSESISENVFYGNVVESAKYPLLPVLSVALLSVSNLNSYTWEHRFIETLIFATIMILVTLCITQKCTKITQNMTSKREQIFEIVLLIVIAIYSLFASSYIISQQGANGWIFILFIIFLLIKHEEKWEFRFLIILFMCMLIMDYYTGATFFLLWLMIAMLFSLIKGNVKIRSILTMSFIIYILVYIVYGIYIASSRYMTMFSVFAQIIDTAKVGFSDFQTAAMLIPNDYIVQSTMGNKIRILVNSILVAIPVLYFLLIWVMKRLPKLSSGVSTILLSGIFALPVLGILSYVWLGAIGTGKLAEYGSLISIIVVASIVPILNKKIKIAIVAIAITAVISSIPAYIMEETTPAHYLTYGESAGANWIIESAPYSSMIFTDQRLSGPIVGKGITNVVGIMEASQGEAAVSLVQGIYYGNNSSEADSIFRYFYMGRVNLLFFSSHMSDNFPAIMLANYPIRHAPHNFMLKYDESSSFEKIYSNNESIIYLRGINL